MMGREVLEELARRRVIPREGVESAAQIVGMIHERAKARDPERGS